MEATNEQIDRNELLASTRAVFVQNFVDGLEGVIKQSAETLLAKADKSPTYLDQRRMLEARGVLLKKSFDLKAQMKKAMEKLLHRSFQTTYSNYRPSFSNSLLDGPISLMDTSAFEDELRFNSITDRFRNEAGEQLRDLNIRIALLFEQDNIRERENPFRPYMFSRAILKSVESVDAPPELHLTLTDQLAEDFAGQVSVIYAAVNSHLAEHGIAAQLMLKPKRSAEPRKTAQYDDDDDDFIDDAPLTPQRGNTAGRQARPQPGNTGHAQAGDHAGTQQLFSQSGAYRAAGQAIEQAAGYAPSQGYAQQGAQAPMARAEAASLQQVHQGQRGQAAPQARAEQPAPSSPVERLFSSVRAFATRSFRTTGGSQGGHAGLESGLGADTGFPAGAFESTDFPQAQHAGTPWQGGEAGGIAGNAGDGAQGFAGGQGAGQYQAGGPGQFSSGVGGQGGTSYGASSAGGIGSGSGGGMAGQAGTGAPHGRSYSGAGQVTNQGVGAGSGFSHDAGAGHSGFAGGLHDAGNGGATGGAGAGASSGIGGQSSVLGGTHGVPGNAGIAGGSSGASDAPLNHSAGGSAGTGFAGESAGQDHSGQGGQGGQRGPGNPGAPGAGGIAGAGDNVGHGAAAPHGKQAGQAGVASDHDAAIEAAAGNMSGYEDSYSEIPEDAAPSGSGSRPSWLSGKKAVGDVLRRFFSGNSAPDDFDEFDDGSDGAPAQPRPAAGLLAGTVQRLIRHSTPATTDMYTGDGEIRNLIMERRSGLTEMANNVKEQMTIDIVSMLFEFILRDTQVPAEVRAQLGRLQFLVLKIALRDESLLTTKAHPARMLVNRIGSISLGLKQIDPSGGNVTQEICRIVEAILADETENPNLFLKMLDDLDTFIARELLSKEKGVSTAVEAVEHAENRTLRLAHTCAQVSESLQGLNINEHLRDFLENHWARAIEYAERNNPAITMEYRAVIPDLLWSVLPKVNENDRQQLLALLPPILKTIHGGMEPVGWPAASKQTLMDWLFDAHTLVLRGNSTGPAPISFSSIHTHFKKFVDNPEAVQPTEPGHVSPENRKGYLEQAMRELDVRINMLDHFFDEELPEDEAPQNESPADKAAPQIDIAERLRVGVAIEVNLGGKPSIGRLNWINQAASNLVLTLNDQAEPSMISVRMFQRMLRNDRVRFLEDEPIFERAVESLLLSASEV